MTSARHGALLTFALFAGLVALKLQVNMGVRAWGPDGSLYVEVARNVRDGHGLVSWISMYHAGVEHFPFPTPLYPAWPTLLGLVARVVPLDLAAVWLPTFLFFGAVILARKLALALWPGPLFPYLWEALDAGHLALLLLGYNALFFEYTSRPYTEGLAFFTLFLFLARAKGFFAAPTALRAAELGAWAGLLILVRAQMFLVTLALGAVFVWAAVALAPRARWARLGAAAAAGWGLALAPQFAHLATFYEPLGLGALLRFEQFRPTPLLAPVKMLIAIDGPVAYALDRARGFVQAYAIDGAFAYRKNFGFFQWAPALAAAGVLLAAATLPRADTRAALHRAVDALRRPEHGHRVLLGLLALGGYFSIHTLHKSYGQEWNFATRHALTVLFLFAWGVVALARGAGPARAAAVAIVAISAWHQARDLQTLFETVVEEEAGTRGYRPGLTGWLAAEKARKGSLVLVSEQATRLAVALPEVPIHWVWWKTSHADLVAIFEARDADYLLVLNDSPPSAFADDPAFAVRFEEVFADLSGARVYRLRQPGAFP